MNRSRATWGRSFDPDRLALLELRMWKAYYRRQPMRLFALLVKANREQAAASWPRALLAAALLARAAAAFGKTGWDGAGADASLRDDPAYLRDIARGYRMLGLPDGVDAMEVARRELRWWTVRRDIGLAAGHAGGDAIANLYSELYGLPVAAVLPAARLRGQAAEFRDRGAAVDPDGPRGRGAAYWPEVGRILVASYRSLKEVVAPEWARAARIDGAAASAPAPAAEHASETDGTGRTGSGRWRRLRPSLPRLPRLPRRLRGSGASNQYSFLTTWLVPGTPEEISAILADPASLPRWWPSVYLDVNVVEASGAGGVGRVIDLYTKGWLPYALRWRFVVTENDPPRGFAIKAFGDFVGRGIWTITPETADGRGPMSRVVYDWRIAAEKPLLKRLSFLMKPIFAANHRWAMARGEESIRLEVARRHAGNDPVLLAEISAPPQPTFRFLLRGTGPAVNASAGRGLGPIVVRPEAGPTGSGDAVPSLIGNAEPDPAESPGRRRWRLPIRS